MSTESTLAVSLPQQLQDVITECNELVAQMKVLQARTSPADPLWCTLDRLRLKVACLRSTAYEPSTTHHAMVLTGQAPWPVSKSAAPQMDGRMRAANDHTFEEEVAAQ